MNEFRSRPRSRFRAAMILAIAADGLQIFVFPLFAEGALSPADDVLDIAVAAVLVHLLGWHYLEAIKATEPQPLPASSDQASLDGSRNRRIGHGKRVR